MEIQEAIEVIRALANGQDPETGEALKDDSVCRVPLRETLIKLSAFHSQSG